MFRIIAIATLVMGSAMAETTLPKGATEIEPGVHRHTDAVGKTYIYRKTPFGIVKSLEAPAPAPADKTDAPKAPPAVTATPTPFGQVKPAATANQLKVTERGDVLEFERSSPFGSYKWKKNKDDLTQVEREAWERGRQASSAEPKADTGPKE